ncbi:SpoIIE family protein phosphatase [Flammeovirga pacifica]|uniref:PPM-type phosphatase domain-containing protein n=1 Tax=Flammeovirga pacifica TaxID=915059 RepID=A0A1S1YUA3_FLAPC|nr:SpoIIE family protein phosphatase [Flammeovirga pacifica]OHX64586.1 hypothetical protein NH26_23735 [Flammeovirga pacifica]
MKWIYFFLITSLLAINAFSNPIEDEKPKPHIRYLNTLDGLSTIDIISIEEDKQGKIWFGNKGGAKGFDVFDGKKFSKWETIENNWLIKNVLKSHKLSNGKVWTLYQNFGNQGSLGVLEPVEKKVFYHHLVKDEQGNQKDLKQIKFIDFFFNEKEDLVYLLDDAKTLYKLTLDEDKRPGVITEINTPIDASKAKYAQTSIYVDIKETIWISHGFHLFMKKDLDQKFREVPSVGTNKDYIINGAYKTKKGNVLWLTNFGIYTVRKGKFVKVISDENHPLNKTKVSSIIEDELGNFWIGTWDGLCRMKSLTSSAKYEIIDNSMEGKIFNCITADSFGGIWFSVKQKGVGYINLYDTSFGIIRHKNNKGKDKYIDGYFKDSKGREWFLTDYGLSVYDPSKKRLGKYKREQKASNKTFPQTDALGIFETKDGSIWIYFVNLYLCRVVGNDVQNLHLDFRYLNMNIIRNISGIQEDDNGLLWISSVEKGVASYNPKTFKLNNYSDPELKIGAISIAKDPLSNSIWFGTSKKGVFKFDVDKKGYPNNIKNYKVSNNINKDNLPIRFLQFDNNHILWGGNRNKYIFNKSDADSIFKTVGVFNDVKDQVFNNIMVDDGAIWIVGDHINYYDLEKKTMINFSPNITKNSLFGKANIFKTDDGNYYFSGSNGVVYTNKSNIEFSPYHPKIYFNDLYVNGERLTNGVNAENEVILKQHLSKTKQLKLSYENNDVAIQLIGIYPPSTGQLIYFYRLKGLNNKWFSTTNEMINFGAITPGDYTIEVYAVDDQGNKSEINAMPLTIQKPWWMYTVVWFAAVLLLIIFGVIIYKMKVKQHKQKAKELEAIVQERTKEIQIRNEELHHQSEELEQQRDNLFEANQTISLKNEMITQSLNYAKTIQETILPIEDQLDAVFTKHYVYYQPKDIVSGDFYWMANEGNRTVIACVDCTGHGVPGALMSMVGNAILNQIIKEKKIFSTKEILQVLDERIKKLLKQEKGFNDDGMDLSICCLEDKGEKIKLTFSGAKNDLYYARSFENQLSVIKGTKRHIGGKISSSREFEEETLYFLKGDRIYLFTDGIIDQHDENRKRFGKKRLIQLIEETMSNSVDEQGELIVDTVGKYSENQTQRDDITFMAMAL